MSGTRPVRLTDLVGLISLEWGAYRNEARPWERLGSASGGGGPHPLESALEEWFSFATGRHTWVDVRRQTIHGLASARRRAGGSLWEVDCLIASEEGVCLRLLDRLCQDAARSGVERVFLRLRADSPLLPVARRASFAPYVMEQLWRGTAPGGATPPTGLPLRQRSTADSFPLFRLYSLAVPVAVRQAEAPTLREWLGALDLRRGGRGLELVRESEGAVVAWVSIARGDGTTRLAFLLHPAEHEHLDALLAAVLARVEGGRALSCLVPTYAVALASALAARGFQGQDEYVSLVRRLARPVTAEAVPQGAQQGYTLPTLLSKP